MSIQKRSQGPVPSGVEGFALVPILVIVGVALVGVVVVPKLIFRSSPKTTEQSSTSTTSDWQTYTSEKFGYSIQHPQGWTVDDSLFPSKQEIMVSSPTKDVALRINAFFDKAMNAPEKVQEAMDKFEEKMRADANLTVAQFTSKVEGKTGGFVATGGQTISGEAYAFESRGLLGTSGKIIIFHGVVKKTAVSQYGDTISRLIESFKLEE